MKDRYDIFGSLPDTIEDEWIEDIEGFEEEVRHYLHKRNKAQDAFEIRYEGNLDPDAERWEECVRVLARRDIEDVMSEPWRARGGASLKQYQCLKVRKVSSTSSPAPPPGPYTARPAFPNNKCVAMVESTHIES